MGIHRERVGIVAIARWSVTGCRLDVFFPVPDCRLLIYATWREIRFTFNFFPSLNENPEPITDCSGKLLDSEKKPLYFSVLFPNMVNSNKILVSYFYVELFCNKMTYLFFSLQIVLFIEQAMVMKQEVTAGGFFAVNKKTIFGVSLFFMFYSNLLFLVACKCKNYICITLHLQLHLNAF